MLDLVHEPHHAKAYDFVLQVPKCALWLDMGLGKTATTLSAIKAFLWSGEVERVLVVAPKRPAKKTWPDEINKWSNFSELTYVVLDGSPKHRKVKLAQNVDITMISYDLLPWLVDLFKGKWPYDMVVLDESSKMKTPSAKRVRAMRRANKYVTRMVQLTGTPATNGLLNLWSQIQLLDGGDRLGKSMGAYKARWFYASGYMGYQYKPHPTSQVEIEDAVSDICLVMLDKDYSKLEPYIPNTIEVELSTKEFKQYKKLENDMYIKIGDAEIEAFNAAAVTSKCLQFTSGSVYHVDEDTEEKHCTKVNTAKLDVLEEMIDDLNGAPVMVAYWWQFDKERLMERFPEAIAMSDREEAVDQWNAGEIPILLVHPLSAGHGLNLQFGGNIMIWYSLTWDLEAYQQMNKRLHRPGQTKPVFVHHLVCAKTLDEEVMKRLASKASVQALLMARMGRGPLVEL